jgi:hypothetical protein
MPSQQKSAFVRRLRRSSIQMSADVYGHLFPRGYDADELAAAEKAFLAI